MNRGIQLSHVAFLIALAIPLLAQAPVQESGQVIEEELDSSRPPELLLEDEQPESDGLERTTIVPWNVEVLGRNFESFPNREASIVLTDWLLNSLINLNVFNVVNRDKIQAVLSEQQLGTISNSSLASAGRLLSVNYILLGNFKNLGQNSEVDFKLLDVNTTAYSHRINFTITFNPEIESMKSEIDRVVARLAARFPVTAQIEEILDDRRLIIGAGHTDGITEAMEAELWRVGESTAERTGYVIGTMENRAEIRLESPAPGVNLFDYVVQVKIVPPAQAALSKGRGLYAAARYEEAVDIFRIGLEADPEDGLLHAFLARSHWKLGSYEAAVESFRRALVLRPDDVELLEGAVAAMLESGHSEEVIETLEKDERMTYSGALALAFGMAHESLGHLDRARDSYRAALRQEPNNTAPHLRLGVLAALTRDVEATSRELVMAQKGVRQSLELDMGIGALAIVQGESAPEGTLEVLADQAKNARDLSALTTASEVLLLDPAQWQLSLKLAQQAIDISPRYVRASIAAARAHAAGAQTAQAISQLNEALGSYPNNVALLLLSGDLLTAEGDLNEARSRYQRAAELNRDDWRASRALGDLYTIQQDPLKAARSYLVALERAEGSDTADLTELSYKVGRSAALAKQFDLARPHLESCVERAPDHVDCQFHLGVCYFNEELGQSTGAAIEAFMAAGNIAESAYYLGALHERRASFDDALVWYRRCARDGCAFRTESEKRLDILETLTGSVTQSRDGNPPQVTLDIGRIHGIAHGKEGVLVQGSSVAGRVRVEEMREDTSVALVLKGTPRVGQTVRFRPARPKDLTVEPHPKSGVVVRWRPNREPELDYYNVFSSSGSRGPWRPLKKVRPPKHELTVKSIKPGERVYFRLVAVSDTRAESLPRVVAAGPG